MERVLSTLSGLLSASQAFKMEAEKYLHGLPRDTFFNDFSNGEVSRMLDRVARLETELLELQRILT